MARGITDDPPPPRAGGSRVLRYRVVDGHSLDLSLGHLRYLRRYPRRKRLVVGTKDRRRTGGAWETDKKTQDSLEWGETSSIVPVRIRTPMINSLRSLNTGYHAFPFPPVIFRSGHPPSPLTSDPGVVSPLRSLFPTESL